jgi:hypothetical protein
MDPCACNYCDAGGGEGGSIVKLTMTAPAIGNPFPLDQPLLPTPVPNPRGPLATVTAQTELNDQVQDDSAHTEPGDLVPASSALSELGDQAQITSTPLESTEPVPVSSAESESSELVPISSIKPADLAEGSDHGPLATVFESEFQPMPGIVFGPDGRFRRVIRLNRDERRFLRKFEPELDTMDLKAAKELILRHLHADRISTINVAFTLLQIRDRYLFTQDGYLDFPTWLKLSQKI